MSYDYVSEMIKKSICLDRNSYSPVELGLNHGHYILHIMGRSYNFEYKKLANEELINYILEELHDKHPETLL